MEKITLDGITLSLASPVTLPLKWVGQEELLKQLLAAWLVIDEHDLPFSPRLVGKPGVGKTTIARLLAARAGVRATGVDIATNSLQQARARAAAEGLSVQFDEGDAEADTTGGAGDDGRLAGHLVLQRNGRAGGRTSGRVSSSRKMRPSMVSDSTRLSYIVVPAYCPGATVFSCRTIMLLPVVAFWLTADTTSTSTHSSSECARPPIALMSEMVPTEVEMLVRDRASCHTGRPFS